MARDESKNLEVAPKLMSVDTGSERPGRRREIRKETSEYEVRVALIWCNMLKCGLQRRVVENWPVFERSLLLRWFLGS